MSKNTQKTNFNKKNDTKNTTSIFKNDLKKNEKTHKNIVIRKKILNPIWLSVSESAKLGGVQTKTIRRAIKANAIRYKIKGNRYFLKLNSLVNFLHTTTKLKKKLKQSGIGQYIDTWEDWEN